MDDENSIQAPASFNDYTQAGMDALLLGRVEKALHLLDAAYYLYPEKRPQLWQRGLACYYGGRFEDGAAQFEIDMKENSLDVEEVLWHFMCSCKHCGFENARERGFLHLSGEPNIVPMKEVLGLFQGTQTVEDVLKVATPEPGQQTHVESYNGTNALAYAHFYAGLYFEVTGDIKSGLTHLEKAAAFENPDFMGKLMKFHFEFSKTKAKRDIPSLVPFRGGRIIQGGWQLSSGHQIMANPPTPHSIVTGLLKAIDYGITSFDCGDIYTGVERLYGKVLKAHCRRGGSRKDIKILTKFVPDLQAIQAGQVDEAYVRSSVQRSLGRLETTYLDVVQFHWWDHSAKQYLDIIRYLSLLQQEGVIRKIGLTNFNMDQCRELLSTGVKISSIQVQYSLLDRRPDKSGLAEMCMDNYMDVFAYGVLAGGFLTDEWLGKPPPSSELLANRSLVKYWLIIEEFGGWELFQELLEVLKQIAEDRSPIYITRDFKVNVTIAMVAIQYVLSRHFITAIITTAHKPCYQESLVGACYLRLTPLDLGAIEQVLSRSGVSGEVYGLERCRSGSHGRIMKYNLNQVNQAAHLEEICERFVELYFSAHPEEATRMGYHPSAVEQCLADSSGFDYFNYSLHAITGLGYDASVNLYTEKEIANYVSTMKGLYHEIEGIDENSVNEDQLVDQQLLKSRIMLELLQWEKLEKHKKDLLHYLPVNSINLLLPVWGGDTAGSKAYTSQRVHPAMSNTSLEYRLVCLLVRLQSLPRLLLQAEQVVRQPCKEVVETAIQTCKHLETFLVSEFPQLISGSVSNTDLHSELVSTALIGAASINKFCRFIEESLQPNSSSGSIVGKEHYTEILQYEHLLEGTDELLAIGETHFTRIKQELALLAAKLSPGKSWQDITRYVIWPHHPTSDQLLDAYMSEIDNAKSHMLSQDLVSSLPRGEKVVGFYTPEILRPFSPFGDFLNPPPFGTSNTGQLMLHSVQALQLDPKEEERLLQAHDYTWIRVIAPHECYPGHHVQALHAQQNPRLLRRFVVSTYFYEGWGLYTEELAFETGYFARQLVNNSSVLFSTDESNSLTRLTQLRLQLWRAARVILDIKLNTGCMTFAECQEFLEQEVMFDPDSSRGEVYMYLSRPGYAPCYLAGLVEIMKLRDELKGRLGDEFSLKSFHDLLLSKGCLPFKLLRILLKL